MEEGAGDTFREVLMGHKLALVPKNFPERHFSEEASEMQRHILDEIFSAEGVCLQFKRCFPERGALVMLCANDKTRDWLQGLAPGLGISGSKGIGVQVYLRVYGPLPIARKFFVSDWKVVGDVHMGGSRTMVMLVDEQSAATLKVRN
ncbi:hypothetical protein J6590_022238 [Homalodisca vitripennis]|nr:hypothetical protein J6590_022238 [Homalodisca vitripennis]